MDKPSRNRENPAAKKAKDNMRLRKVSYNSSEKGSRKIAPMIKTSANRKIRRTASSTLENQDELSAASISAQLVRRDRTWGSFNAAERREERRVERAILDETAGHGPKGRRRALGICPVPKTEKREK